MTISCLLLSVKVPLCLVHMIEISISSIVSICFRALSWHYRALRRRSNYTTIKE